MHFYSLRAYKFEVWDGKYILCCYTFVYGVLWSKFLSDMSLIYAWERHHPGQWSTIRGPHVASIVFYCRPRAFSNTFDPCSLIKMKGKVLVTRRISLSLSNLEKMLNLQWDSFILNWQTSFVGKLETMEAVRQIRSVLILSVQLYFGYNYIECNSVYLFKKIVMQKRRRGSQWRSFVPEKRIL